VISETATAKPFHSLTARMLVFLYLVISTCTVVAGLYLAFVATTVVIRGGFGGYCYHGGGGELFAYALSALSFGWPIIALQVGLSLFAARKIGRWPVVAATLVLPIVMLVGLLPCV
jgi:hypothetical protein